MQHIKVLYENKQNSESERYEENINKAEQGYANSHNDDERRVWQETIDMLKNMYEESKAENEMLKQNIENYKQQATNSIKNEVKKVNVDDVFDIKATNIQLKCDMPTI